MLRVFACIIQRVTKRICKSQEALMMTNEIRTSIKTVYGMLWDVLALYEKTDCYNELPKGESGGDVWDYMGDKLLNVRKTINMLFLGEDDIKDKLVRIVDETEQFVRIYERPGVVKRWKKINPQILFFECAFDLMENCPNMYKEISWGFTDLKLACYPDDTLVEARKRYFAEAKKKIEDGNFQYSEDRVFQNELLRTLTLVFENDFRGYL